MGDVRTLAAMAIAVASLAARASPADDAPPKPESARPLRLALEAGKTYVYRFRQTTTHRMTEGRGSGGRKESEGRTDLEWNVGMSLVRVEPNGQIVVSLLPERVHGRVQRPGGVAIHLDSAVEESFLNGWVAKATLSPQGRVVEASWAQPGRADEGPLVVVPRPPSEATASPTMRVDGAMRSVRWDASSFVRLFVHEFQSEPPRANGSWTVRRELPPEWRVSSGSLLSDGFLYDDWSATYSAAGNETVARFSLGGKRDVARLTETIDLTAGLSRDEVESLRFADIGEQVASWTEKGELRLKRDSGLTSVRRSEGSVSTHANAVLLPKSISIVLPAPGPWGLPETPTDHVYEFTTRLELVDVR